MQKDRKRVGFHRVFLSKMQVKGENPAQMENWKEARRALCAGAALGALAFLLPLLVFGLDQEQAAAPESSAPAASQPAAGWDGAQTVRLLHAGEDEVEELSLDDYLWRVVAAEMPASFEPEALRAQAVCARTYSLWKLQADSHGEEGADLCDDSACCQAYLTPEEAAENWGDSAQAYGEKIAAAVADTDAQVLTYEDAPIQAVFFSSSTDSTEDAAQVWGNSLPYLVSVSSPEGEEVPNYRSTVVLTAAQLRELAAENYPQADLSGDPAHWVGEVRYNASGRVASLELGGVSMSGGAARNLFGLRSACFTVEYGEDGSTFSVVGYGHGVGMSQYGANAMAREGADWREIVEHYYTGVCIQSWQDREQTV